MRVTLSTWLPIIGLLTLAATPAMAQTQGGHTGFWGTAPSFYYQSPDGSYDSYADYIRDLRGRPCGIECTQRAEARWGLIPPRHHHRHHY